MVTGTNSGIGKATATLLAGRGARVIGLDAKGDGAGLGGFHHCDLTDPASIEAGLAWVRDHPMSGPDAYTFSKEVAIVYAIAGSMLARPHGVRSLAVSPGAVETPILKDFYDTMGADVLDRQKAQSGGCNAAPEDIARVIAFALSEDATWLNGTDIVVDGGGGTVFHFDLVDVDAVDAAKTFFGS